MSTYIGIDPGLSGYLAVIDGDGEVTLIGAPVLLGQGKGKRRYDLTGMIHVLRVHAPGASLCVIEKQQPMPKQGVTSTFSIGYGYGLWRMGLVAAGIPHEEVAPVTWKTKLGVKGVGKDAATRKKDSKRRSIEKAQALFPGVSLLPTPLCRVASHDMAEALLLAHFARQKGRGAVL